MTKIWKFEIFTQSDEGGDSGNESMTRQNPLQKLRQIRQIQGTKRNNICFKSMFKLLIRETFWAPTKEYEWKHRIEYNFNRSGQEKVWNLRPGLEEFRI